MKEKTLNDILADFGPLNADRKTAGKGRSPVTIWLDPESKARYDKLQISSGRGFSKKAREVLLALIEAAEAKTA
jgi:hypothetical protein